MKKLIGTLIAIVFLLAFMFFLPSNATVDQKNSGSDSNQTATETAGAEASNTDTNNTSSEATAPSPSNPSNTSPTSVEEQSVNQNTTSNQTTNQTSNQTTSQTQKPTPTQTQSPASTSSGTAAAPTPTPTAAQAPATTVPEPTSGSSSPATSTSPSSAATASISADQQHMLDLVNAERDKLGITPLKFNTELNKIALLKAEDMVNNNYFSHTSPTYGSPFDMLHQFDVSYRYAGENLAGNSSVDKAHTAFMNSDGHRANILKTTYDEIGIGIMVSPKYGYVFVQIFIGL